MEPRGQQHLNLEGKAWHLCNQVETARRSGWIPNLTWNTRIGLKVQRDRNVVLTNLMKHINLDTLREAFHALDGTKALGVDWISKAAYGEDLERNLTNLCERVHKGSYRPQAKREVLIPKTDGTMRPLAISCFEDKIVDAVLAKMLNAVYEPLFIRNSFGYRASKSAHGAINASYNAVKNGRRPYVVEIDFKAFFNTIPHQKLLKIIGKRIQDHRLLRLILLFLKGGILREGVNVPTELGTPQGGSMSPALANIYLHEVLDSWFLKNWAKGINVIVRIGDRYITHK